MEKISVYCYFLKSHPNELYAFTINKEYKNLFEKERCMKKFIYGKKKMSDSLYKVFSNENKLRMMHEDIVTDKDKNYTMILTSKESSEYSEAISYISDFLISLYAELEKDETDLIINEKYLKSIKEITKILMHDKQDIQFLNINTFKLFLYLFKETMYESDEIQNDFYNLENRDL